MSIREIDFSFGRRGMSPRKLPRSGSLVRHLTGRDPGGRADTHRYYAKTHA